MQPKKGEHENPLPSEISKADRQQADNAYNQASSDISNDADISIHSPNDELDEGELARLGDKTDLV